MSFWRYFKAKVGGIAGLVLGFVVIGAGALTVAYLHPTSATGIGLNVETFCCGGGALIIAVGAIVIAYGQKKLKTLDE